LYGRNLQYIRVSEDRAILKRGAIELLLSGEGVHAIIELLLPMLDGRQNRRQILETFPEDQREVVVRKVGSKVVLEPVDVWPSDFLSCMGAWRGSIPRPKDEPDHAMRDPFE